MRVLAIPENFSARCASSFETLGTVWELWDKRAMSSRQLLPAFSEPLCFREMKQLRQFSLCSPIEVFLRFLSYLPPTFLLIPDFMDSLILITGISGFIGAEVAVQFLRAGYKIRGTVRQQSQADAFVTKYEEEFPGLIEVVIVERLDAKGAFDEAVKGVSAIMHIASPLPLIAKVRTVSPGTGDVNVDG